MSQGLLSLGIAHWPGLHSDPMDGATSLPPDTVRLGGPRSCPRHPRGVRSTCRLCTTSPSGLSSQRVVLCDHMQAPRPQLASQDNSHHFIILRGVRLASSQGSVLGVQKQAGGGGGGVSLVWPRGWAGGCPLRRGLGDGEPPVGQGWGEATASLLLTQLLKPQCPSQDDPWEAGDLAGSSVRGGMGTAAPSGVRPRGAQGLISVTCRKGNSHLGRSQHLWAPSRAGSLQPCCAWLAGLRCSSQSRWWGAARAQRTRTLTRDLTSRNGRSNPLLWAKGQDRCTREEKELGCKKVRLGALPPPCPGTRPHAGFPEPAAPPTRNEWTRRPQCPRIKRGLGCKSPKRGVCAETAELVVLEQLRPRRPWGSASVPPAPSVQSEGGPQITAGAGCRPQIIVREGCPPDRGGGGVMSPDHRGGGVSPQTTAGARC